MPAVNSKRLPKPPGLIIGASALYFYTNGVLRAIIKFCAKVFSRGVASAAWDFGQEIDKATNEFDAFCARVELLEAAGMAWLVSSFLPFFPFTT